MYSAAKEGHLPSCFSVMNNETQSPRAAIFAQSALAIAISFVGNLDELIGYAMFGFWTQRIFSLVALLTIRHKGTAVHPDAIRIPIPLWVLLGCSTSCHFICFSIVTFLAITIGLVIIPIFHEFKVTALGLVICVVGLGFYYLLVYPKRLPRGLEKANGLFL